MAVLPPDPVFTLRTIEETPIHSISFYYNQQGQYLIAGCQDGYVFTFNLATNRVVHKFSSAESAIMKIYRSHERLYTQEKNGMIKIWTVSESGYKHEKTLKSNYCGFCRCHISDDEDLIIAPDKDSKINLLTKSGGRIATLSHQQSFKLGEVMCLKYLNLNGPCLLAAHESGDVFLWDLKAKRVLSDLKLKEFPVDIDYDVTTGRGVYGSASELIQVFSVSSINSKMSLKCDIVMKNPGVNALKIREDRKVFACGGWDGRLRVYSWKSLRPLAVLTEHKEAIQDVCFSSVPIAMWNSPIMAAAGTDGSVSLWDIYN